MASRQDPARRRVVAWGTSVLASALVAGLAERTEFDVAQVEATLPAAFAEVRRRRPVMRTLDDLVSALLDGDVDQDDPVPTSCA